MTDSTNPHAGDEHGAQPGYQQPGYQQSGYQQPGYQQGYPQQGYSQQGHPGGGQSGWEPAPPRALSISSMAIGIASILFFWWTLIVPLVGLVLGILGLKREPEGRAFALVGIWTNAAVLALSVLGVVVAVVLTVVIGIPLLGLIPFLADQQGGIAA